jgi:hypothetical protein
VSAAAGLSDKVWFNALWFQGFWLCAVLGRDRLLPALLTLLALHLWLVTDRRREVLRIAPVAALGMAVDGALSFTGVYQFPNDVLLPIWLACLWCGFATTLWRSLGFLRRHPVLVWVAGAVALPLNYWAGQRLGAVEFGLPLLTTLGLLACIWLLALPLMYFLAARGAQAGELRPCY